MNAHTGIATIYSMIRIGRTGNLFLLETLARYAKNLIRWTDVSASECEVRITT